MRAGLPLCSSVMRRCWLVLLTTVSLHGRALPARAENASSAAITVENLPRAAGAGPVAAAAQLLQERRPAAALLMLGDAGDQAALLVRARAERLVGDLSAAQEALARAQATRAASNVGAGTGMHGDLAPLLTLEAGLQAVARADTQRSQELLMPLMTAGNPLAPAAAAALSQILPADPVAFLEAFAGLELFLDAHDLDARSRLLEAKARSQERLGLGPAAQATRMQRFLEEPVSPLTPTAPPSGLVPTPEQWLARANRLLDANRNERALAAARALDEGSLSPAQRCQKWFIAGLAARKLRRYADAELALGQVADTCDDVDLARRAAYLRVKVISIRDGLRAIAAVEAFAKKYPTHSMTDDVLFWAGDLYQRRGKDSDAQAYFARIDALPQPGDMCAEARWRTAWMAYRRQAWPEAKGYLERLLRNDGCTQRFDQSRARYWLGRLAEQQSAPSVATEHYAAIVSGHPLSYYAQLALPRLLKLLSGKRLESTLLQVMAPRGSRAPALCPDWLAASPGFSRALYYLQEGLGPDAAAELLALQPPEQDVLGGSHAASLGVEERPVKLLSAQSLQQCGPAQAALLIVLLLDRAGAQHDAHWRMRTEFGDEFTRIPTAGDMVLWRAAYPLAYRNATAPAEEESHLPQYFLQALAREESAFDPQVVSWAEAYGLTQLLFSSAQGAAKLLHPPLAVAAPEVLLEPEVNARLGGALLGSMVRRFSGNLGLALAAYNAGEDVANTWAKRFAGQEFAVYAEEIGIQETRGYVKRVLRTYGIYRWLYAAALASLPIEPNLPGTPADKR